MTGLARTLAGFGIRMPGSPELIEAGIALALALAALTLGWLAGRRLAPRIAALWERRVGEVGTGIVARFCTVVRHGTAAVLLAILAGVWPWAPLSTLGLAIALGGATALLLIEILRTVHLPRWVAWSAGLLAFAAIVSNAIGGWAMTTDALEQVGFDVGKRRFSLLSALTLTLTAVALFAAVRLANRVIAHSVGQARGFDATQKLLVQKLSGVAVLVAAFFLGVDLLDIDLTTFAVFSGAFGLAIGFGLQKTVGNLIAGIILLMDRSIKPGDVIVVGDSFGWVNKIGVRAVSVITREGKEHLIPNENLMTQEVENWSYSDRNVRVRIPVAVGYETDLKLAQALMLRAAVESPRVLTNPVPNVWLTSYGEYALEHEILAWIADPEGGVGNVKSDVLNRLWELFQEHGIVIPVPRRELIWRGMPELPGEARGTEAE
jgi:small-conductance mechanosensitive channel